MRLHRMIVAWAGAPVKGAAVNVLHFDGAESAAPNPADVLTAYQQLSGVLANTTGVTIPTSGDTIEDTTGELVGTWAAAGGGAVVGTAGNLAAAGVGASVSWLTGGIVRGHRLRGRSYIVPLSLQAYDSDGTLTAPALTAVQNFGNALVGGNVLAVWHRPTSKGAADGTSYGAIQARVRDKVAFLSSRRD